MTDYDRTIHDSPDASRWAKFFMETLEENSWTMDDIDEGLMIGWFANAMEAMRSHHSPVYLQGTVPGLVSDALRFAQEAHIDRYAVVYKVNFNGKPLDLTGRQFEELENFITKNSIETMEV